MEFEVKFYRFFEEILYRIYFHIFLQANFKIKIDE